MSIRVLFLSDTHLGFDLPARPRVKRRRRGHDFLANYHRALEPALAGDVDLLVHGGDVFHRPRVPPSLVYQAFEPLVRVADAGVPVFGLSLAQVLQPLPVGIAAGLVFGNLVGVTGMSALAVKLGLASLPEGVRWPHVVGTSLLCGVGFTMSLFIASLAFEQGGPEYPGIEQLGILVGSLVAASTGFLVLRLVDRAGKSRLGGLRGRDSPGGAWRAGDCRGGCGPRGPRWAGRGGCR